MNEHKAGTKFRCHQCDKTFASAFSLKRHKVTCHKNQCHPSGKGSLEHMRYEHPQEKDNETRCHVWNGMMRCKQCGTTFTLLQNFRRHVRESCTHSTPQRPACSQCGMTFVRLEILNRHVYEQHILKHLKNQDALSLPADREVSSANCTARDLNKRTAEQNGPLLTCDLCGMTTNRKYSLKRHIRDVHVHEGKEMQTCAHCDQHFTRKDSLRRHIQLVHRENDIQNVHVGREKLTCAHCDQQFKRKDTLKTHIVEVHGDTEVLSCAQCGQSFKRNGTLKRHIEQIHGDPEHLSCFQCDTRFKRKYALNRHINSVHGEREVLSCVQCDRRFTRKDSLERHILHLHNKHRTSRPKE